MTQQQAAPNDSPDISALTEALSRDVYCLFGLPVDNHTLASTKDILRERIQQGRKTVLSTINLNWVAQSLRDSNFYQAILNSDLVVIDGKPLLWLAQLVGCPMQETVPGSTLIEELLNEGEGPPLTIFLFGGDQGAAEQAMQCINERDNAGLKAVGALNPGFGSVEEMSSSEILDTINAAEPDILLVALGAKKGTQWIEYNRDRLNAKIISHLGATINFLAGTVKRAPRFMQRFGLEWLWRVAQEPQLFFRYASDGKTVLNLLLSRLILWFRYLARSPRFNQEPLEFTGCMQDTELTSIIAVYPGDKDRQGEPLRDLLCSESLHDKEVILDFKKIQYVDNSLLGMLLLLHQQLAKTGRELALINIASKVKDTFYLFSFPNTIINKTKIS